MIYRTLRSTLRIFHSIINSNHPILNTEYLSTSVSTKEYLTRVWIKRISSTAVDKGKLKEEPGKRRKKTEEEEERDVVYFELTTYKLWRGARRTGVMWRNEDHEWKVKADEDAGFSMRIVRVRRGVRLLRSMKSRNRGEEPVRREFIYRV